MILVAVAIFQICILSDSMNSAIGNIDSLLQHIVQMKVDILNIYFKHIKYFYEGIKIYKPTKYLLQCLLKNFRKEHFYIQLNSGITKHHFPLICMSA